MDKEIKVKGMRKIIAQRMGESWNSAPRVVYTLSVDMTKPLAFINALNKDNDDKASKITINHVLMKICAEAMKEFEYVNASFTDDAILVHEEINIGLAVAVKNGLIVPNVKNIESKSFKEIAKDANDKVMRARNNKLDMDDITGGTFTISNLGMMGIENFSPIINLPEVAILGVNKIIETPVVENGEIIFKPKMNLNFVADHRVIDGAYAAQYISKVKEMLEALEA